MKQKIAVIIFLFFLFPVISLACSVPFMGSEFDALIHVKKVDKNKFKAMISKQAISLEYGADIRVGYYPSGTDHKTPEYWKNINANEHGEYYVATFELVSIEGYTPFVLVNWFPERVGLCGAYGKSGDLEVE